MTRIDYLNEPTAPKPNSIIPAATAVILYQGKILLEHRQDNKLWGLPGGAMEIGESIRETVIREVKEETGLQIAITRFIGVYSNPNHIIAFSDGEIRQEFSLCFKCKVISGKLEVSNESTEVGFFKPKEIRKLPISESTLLRIDHALSRKITPFIG